MWSNFLAKNPGYQVPSAKYSSVSSINEANRILNSGRMAGAIPEDIVPTRGGMTAAAGVSDAGVIADTYAATQPKSLEQRYLDLRAKNGLDELEKRAKELLDDENAILAQKRQRILNAQNDLVSIDVINGRVGQIEAQEDARLSSIKAIRDGYINEITKKNEAIAKQMGFAKDDQTTRYTNAYRAATLAIQAGNHELAVQRALSNLPAGRSITINGTKYQGLAENDAAKIVQTTDPSGNTYVVGVDPTGKILYRTFVGRERVPGGGGGGGGAESPQKELSRIKAEQELSFIKNRDQYVRGKDGNYYLKTDISSTAKNADESSWFGGASETEILADPSAYGLEPAYFKSAGSVADGAQ